MPSFTDQAGRTISLTGTPRRIISLVPSQTELLYDLGLEKEVVGITKFCVHPSSWFKSKARVGGTKQVKMDRIQQLQPDLILANKEENTREQIEELEKNYPVWVSDVHNLDSACEMIEQVGLISGKQEAAVNMTFQIRKKFASLPPPDSRLQTPACYLIWYKPLLTIGGDTFIHAMLEKAGFSNIFSGRGRYPEITTEELRMANCELILLPSEPFPFKQKQVDELKAMGIKARIILADGEMFSWYGSRLLKTPAYFKELWEKIGKI